MQNPTPQKTVAEAKNEYAEAQRSRHNHYVTADAIEEIVRAVNREERATARRVARNNEATRALEAGQ